MTSSKTPKRPSQKHNPAAKNTATPFYQTLNTPAAAPPIADTAVAMVETNKAGQPPPARFLFKGEVQERTGLSYPTIWAKMCAGEFPAGREVFGKTGWIESEIEQWIQNRPKRKYNKKVTEDA